ncbi:MAG: VanZ family protein [Verrucomicrobiota bacterium]
MPRVLKLPAFSRKASFWLSCFAIWFLTLWYLSSIAFGPQKTISVRHLDKIAHFGYFFGGAGLLAAGLHFLSRPTWPPLKHPFATPIILLLVGALDEWHQSWHPLRSGLDPLDLAADFVGALVGTLVFRALQPRVFPSLPVE